jgi:hypothetical protein
MQTAAEDNNTIRKAVQVCSSYPKWSRSLLSFKTRRSSCDLIAAAEAPGTDLAKGNMDGRTFLQQYNAWHAHMSGYNHG